MGMLCEMNPTVPFNDLVARELQAAGVDPHAVSGTGL